MLSNKVKGYLSIIAGFCLHLIIGSLYTWAVINTYYATYMRNHGNPSITFNNAFFLMPTIITVQYCTLSLGVKFGDTVGVRMYYNQLNNIYSSTLVSGVLMILCYLSLIYLTNFYVVMLTMFVYGLADGLGNLTVIKNAWRYFPNNKGLVNGIILGGLGLSAAFLNPIADYIINPDQVNPLDDGFFPKEIGDNIKSFFFFLIIVFSILAAIAVGLSFPFDEMQIDSSKDAENIIENKAEGLNCNDDNKDNDVNEANKKCKVNNECVSYAYYTKENLQLSIFCFGTPFFCFLLTNTNRAFGSLNHLDQKSLQVMSFVFGLLNGSTRFIWGFCLDKVGFRILMLIICILELIVSVSVYFIATNLTLYFIENMVIASCLSGGFTLLTPTFNKVFGTKLGTTLYGIGACFIGLASILGPVLTKFIIKTKADYLIVYLSGSVFVLMSGITLIFFKEQPLNYGNSLIVEPEVKEEDNDQHEKQSEPGTISIMPKDEESSDSIDQYNKDN